MRRGAIKLAEEKQVHVLSDEDAIRAYEYRQKMQWDEISFRNDAIREGKAEGRAEGYERANLDIARKLKARGRPLAEIVEDTGLSLEAVENL